MEIVMEKITTEIIKQKLLNRLDIYLDNSNLTSSDFYNLVHVLSNLEKKEEQELLNLCRDMMAMTTKGLADLKKPDEKEIIETEDEEEVVDE